MAASSARGAMLEHARSRDDVSHVPTTQADSSTEAEWQIWTAICWLPTARRGGVDRRRRGRRRRHVRAGSGRRCSSTAVLHTDLKPVDDSREKAGAAGDAGPSFEHRRALRAAHHVHPSVRADRHEAASSTMKIIAIPDTTARAQRSRPWLEPRRRRPHAGRVRRGTLVRDLC